MIENCLISPNGIWNKNNAYSIDFNSNLPLLNAAKTVDLRTKKKAPKKKKEKKVITTTTTYRTRSLNYKIKQTPKARVLRKRTVQSYKDRTSSLNSEDLNQLTNSIETSINPLVSMQNNDTSDTLTGPPNKVSKAGRSKTSQIGPGITENSNSFIRRYI